MPASNSLHPRAVAFLTRRLRLGGGGTIVALAAAIGIVAFLWHSGHVAQLRDLARPWTLAWPVLAIAFFVAEVRTINVEFRREAQAFSLNELPIVFGLFFLPVDALLTAWALGTIVALVGPRGQRGPKLAFNLAQMWLGLLVAISAFHLITSGQEVMAREWVAALVATTLNSATNVVLITTGISVAERRLALPKLREVGGIGMMATVTTTSVALIGVTLMWEDPAAAPLLLIPAGAVFLMFRAYINEKRKHLGLEFLYEASRIMNAYPEVEAALRALLQQTRETFGAAHAEIVLFPSGNRGQFLRGYVTEDTVAEMGPTDAPTTDALLMHLVSALGASRFAPGSPDTPLAEYVRQRGFRDALVAPLRGEDDAFGAIIVANRLVQVSSFSEEDMRLFETFANQASVSLENGRLERTLAQLTELKEELAYRADHDTLTGLANRTRFRDQVDAALADPAAEAGSVALIYVDVDDFKWVNDTHGHAIGDALLMVIAERLRGCLRTVDMAARLGGDEFAVLLTTLASSDEARAVADRIMSTLRQPVEVDGHRLHPKASIGIAVDTTGAAANQLISDADVAMYHVKNASKGNMAVFEPSMRELVVERANLTEELAAAIERDEFVVHYQPLFDFATGDIAGVEALVRWQHPERGLVMPGEFIELCEATGLIEPLGHRVLVEACRTVGAWSRELDRALLVSVNVSAHQFRNEALAEMVRHAVERAGLQPDQLILEITEGTMVDEGEETLERLHELRELGVQIAIDDFGTGYSSLAYLRRYPMDIVKIPRPFVEDISAGDDTLARAVIELARALGQRVIAEGIEEASQYDRLRVLGCHMAQGFLMARPAPAEEIAARLQEMDRTPRPRLALVASNQR